MSEPQRFAYTGLVVCLDQPLAVATLRYFTPEGEFAAEVHKVVGTALPPRLRAYEADGLILAWRGPTETLCLTSQAGRLAALAARLAGIEDGCLVELTGGLKVVRLTGERIGDLLARLGGAAAAPSPGESRRGRMADVPVQALAIRPGETWLVVDRALLTHVLGWIRATLADLEPA